MAQEFVRNIKHTDVTKEPLYTTQQNDLISDDKDVYVHNNGKYEKITGNDNKQEITTIKNNIKNDIAALEKRITALEKPTT